MLKIIGVTWVILAVLVVLFTMVITAVNPIPMVAEEVIAVDTSAELWIRSLSALGVLIVSMAGVRFGATPLKRMIENAKATITSNGKPETSPSDPGGPI